MLHHKSEAQDIELATEVVSFQEVMCLARPDGTALKLHRESLLPDQLVVIPVAASASLRSLEREFLTIPQAPLQLKPACTECGHSTHGKSALSAARTRIHAHCQLLVHG
jgi:hypothetical protein